MVARVLAVAAEVGPIGRARVLGVTATVAPDTSARTKARVLGVEARIAAPGGMRVLGVSAAITRRGRPQLSIVSADGTRRYYDEFVTAGGRRNRLSYVSRRGAPVDPGPVDPGPVDPGPGPGEVSIVPWPADGIPRWENSGLDGAGVTMAQLTNVTVTQLKALQADAAKTGQPIEFINCVGSVAQPVSDPGGLTYRYCRIVGMLPPTDRGPIYTAYDTWGRVDGTAGKHLLTPNYGTPRSTFEFCDIGQDGHNGELVKPWVANTLHQAGVALAYGGRVWRVLTTNSDATPPSAPRYQDIRANNSRSVELSNYISDVINPTAPAGERYNSLRPIKTASGATAWHIGGDPLMYGPGLWDALPGSFWNVSIQEGPKLFYRCKMLGGGDLTRVNKSVELQRSYIHGINRGYSGGYSRISGMYPDRPETWRWHSDCLQSVGIPAGQSGPQNVIINECYVRGMTADGAEMANAALIAKADVGGFDNFQFTNNVVDGGGYTLYPCIPGTATSATFRNCVFRGNRFGTPGKGYTSRYGPVGWGSATGPQPGVLWDPSNRWLETGTTVQLDGKTIRRVKDAPVLDPSTYKVIYA